MRLNATMHQQMKTKSLSVSGRISALCAFVRLLTSVGQLMILKMFSPSIILFAFITGEQFLASVNAQM